jgi:hypothetical protein
MAGLSTSTEAGDKRTMSTIDLEQEMLQQIVRSVNEFFHPEIRKLSKLFGRPYRHRFLL